MATKSEKLTPAQQKLQDYLNDYAKEDKAFAKSLSDKEKSFEKCWEYVRFKAQKQAVNGCACIEDEDVYNWAVHYYDESNKTIETEMGKSRAIESAKAKVEAQTEQRKAVAKTTKAKTKSTPKPSNRKVTVPNGGITISLFK